MVGLSRREMMCGGLAAPLLTVQSRASTAPVQYLLVRRGGLSNQCIRCIPGKLYGVPSTLDLATVSPNHPLLQLVADTIELGYEDNNQDVSSIPLGTYPAFVRQDAAKKWMWSTGELGKGTVILDRAWRIELQKTGPRSFIQFHYGQDVSWSNGCVMIGKQSNNQCRDDCKFTDSPAIGTRSMRGFFEANAVNVNHPIRVRLIEGQV
jgi:hypothetical protein